MFRKRVTAAVHSNGCRSICWPTAAPSAPTRLIVPPASMRTQRCSTWRDGHRGSYSRGRVVDGIIGSSDMWIDELDRVAQFHSDFGTSVEEMETASAAQVASAMHVPSWHPRAVRQHHERRHVRRAKAGEACQDFCVLGAQGVCRGAGALKDAGKWAGRTGKAGRESPSAHSVQRERWQRGSIQNHAPITSTKTW